MEEEGVPGKWSAVAKKIVQRFKFPNFKTMGLSELERRTSRPVEGQHILLGQVPNEIKSQSCSKRASEERYARSKLKFCHLIVTNC